MRPVREGTEQGSKGKSRDQFCGRLIIWDVGAPRDDIVILASDYWLSKPDLFTQNGTKACTLDQNDGKLAASTSSLKPIAERFYLK